MLLTEYNEAETMELFKEEGRAEGRKEGRAEGREEGRTEAMMDAAKKIAAKFNLSLEEAKAVLSAN